MHTHSKTRTAQLTYWLLFFALFFLGSVGTAFGAHGGGHYVPLVALPAVEGSGDGLAAYFNKLYMATVAVGAILAFLKIGFAGAKWSLSEVVTDKSSAKEDIQGALLGLAILLVPFIVLNTIYPNLTKLNILEKAGTMKVDMSKTSGAGGGDAGLTPVTTPAPTERLGAGTNAISCTLALGTSTLDPTAPTGYRQNYIDTACRTACQAVSGTFALTGPSEPSKSTCTFTCPDGQVGRTKINGDPVCEVSASLPASSDPNCTIDPNSGQCI